MDKEDIKSYKDLIVWQKSIYLVKEVYTLTEDYPKEELFGLVSQMRRAAVSIPSNIAEGAARNSTRELIQFLYIASGSASELETQLMIAKNLNYLSSEMLFKKTDVVRKMITSLIRSLKRKRSPLITNH